MKKAMLLGLMLILLAPVTLQAESPSKLDSTGRTTMDKWDRFKYVGWRGIRNFFTFYLEVPRAFREEPALHPKAWPVTAPFRAFTYSVVRLSSAGVDGIFYPFLALFTDDLSPFTDAYGLPEFAWQKEVD